MDELMCFRIRTRRQEQGTWDCPRPSHCYCTKRAGDWTSCIWGLVSCWWPGHGDCGYCWVTWYLLRLATTMQERHCVLCSLYAQHGFGERGQDDSFLPGRLQRTVPSASNIFESNLENSCFPSPPATDFFFFPSKGDALQKPLKSDWAIN